MSTDALTDSEIAELIVAVGAEPDLEPGFMDTSFEDLELDSLSRAELAARLKKSHGVDLEADLTADTTPGGLRELLRAARAGAA
ncbi:acyl carrier protein [Nocardiopsis sp. RSe5-2]|uniref:Acyl carrier protein n=1 Tax=Nocardiopsis endophytica TaxID=3018445 RepID=A0ABT4U967_9ACTN|nr:acyl carrier protein [Nocardiopsis endophytica]MDA2813004.1 acyl carrier protein [Nocardiopsis endophytica]